MNNDYNMVKEKIEQADMVLVGIGDEMELPFPLMAKVEPYKSFLDRIEIEPEFTWLIPYLERCFVQGKSGNQYLEAYNKLLLLIQEKNYFIVTTCADDFIIQLDFKKDRIVAPCGGYQMLKCCQSCNDELMTVEELIPKELKCEENLTEDIFKLEPPKCEACGNVLSFNNIYDEHYLEKGYLSAWDTYGKWLQKTMNRNVLVLELGVSLKFPSVIRFPFEKMVFFNQKSHFIRVNCSLFQISDNIKERSISISQNALELLTEED